MHAPGQQSAPTYLDSAEAVDRFLEAIGRPRILALDTEGASFHRFVDRIYLLQLSTREHTAVIDPLPIATPARLGALLEDRAVEIVFHDADYDLRLLYQDYGWRVTNIFDTRVASQLLGLKAFGLAALLEKYFGVKLDKKHQRADWSMRPLTPGMLEYAAQDTMNLLDLRDRLKAELERMGRWEWAAEEFALLEGTRWSADVVDEGFLRVKGARDLTRRELALFRELVQWRDGVARALDRATFRVVSNEVLFEMARSAPADRGALGAIRGMPRGMLEQRSDEMLAAVARGQAVPDDALPKFARGARWDRDPDFDDRVARLKSVRDAAAARLELDPGVLFSRERLETVARNLPATLDALLEIPGIRRWQVAELGSEFLRVIGPPPAARKAVVAPESPGPAPRRRDAEDSPYRDG